MATTPTAPAEKIKICEEIGVSNDGSSCDCGAGIIGYEEFDAENFRSACMNYMINAYPPDGKKPD